MKKIFLLLVLPAIMSCNKMLDINDNPNTAVSSSNDLLLSGALLTSLRVQSTSFNELGCLYGGYWAKANDVTVTAFGTATSSFELAAAGSVVDNLYNELWETSFTNMYNLTLLETQAGNQQPAYTGIAHILKGMSWMVLADHYNNVPFSKALEAGNIHPAYDNGLDVYKGAISLISDGIAAIRNIPAGATKPVKSDILFKGDLTKWIQFANTIKLRGLLQLSQLSDQQSYIQVEMQKIVAEGSGFLNTDAMMNPGFNASLNQQNPYWDLYYKDYSGSFTNRFKAVRPTRYLLSKYDALNDPRKQQVYATTAGGIYAGTVLGQQTADATQNSAATSAFRGPQGGLIKQVVADAIYFPAAESYFLQAEAAYRGWINDNPETLYQNGIKSSFQYLGLTETNADDYIRQAAVTYSSANGLTQIIQQKWLALNGIDGSTAWADYRRLHLPADIPGSVALSATGSIHINRLRYPVSELNTNGEEVARQGTIDPVNDRIFWQPR